MKKLLFLVCAAIFLTACPSTETVESTRISAGNVYQQFNVNAEKSGTNVFATFRVGNENGKTVDLDAPGKIELNGKEMTELAPSFMSGTTYKTDFGKFTSPLQFVFTGADGKIYRNEIRILPIEIVSKNIVLSRRKDTVINLSRAVAEDEKISLGISGTLKDKSADSKSLEARTDATRTAVTIKPEDFKELINGKATINFSVETKQSLKQTANAGGSLMLNYRAAEVAAKIIN